MILVRQVGDEHADGENALHSQKRTYPDNGDTLDSKDQLARSVETKTEPREPDVPIDGGAQEVGVGGLAHLLTSGIFDGLDPADQLQKVTVLTSRRPS